MSKNIKRPLSHISHPLRIISFFRLSRIHHWTKNLLVFAPLFFSKTLFSERLIDTSLAFLAFCLAASTAYVINDIFDIKSDQKNKHKKNRPLASGQVTKAEALILVFFLLLGEGALLCFVPEIFPIILAYFLLNILYSTCLKHVIILDVLIISMMYLLRIMTGGMASQVLVSEWLMLCTIFVSLFMIIGKRQAEFKQKEKRKVLYFYSEIILNTLAIITATLSVITYSLYTILVLPSVAIYSVFFVLAGIFRYLFIMQTSEAAEFPEKVIFFDRIIFCTTISWLLFMYALFYLY